MVCHQLRGKGDIGKGLGDLVPPDGVRPGALACRVDHRHAEPRAGLLEQAASERA